MAGKTNLNFEVACDKHGITKPGYGKICKFIKVGYQPKRKQGCPLCHKEYRQKHNIPDSVNIDWRYIQLDKEVDNING